MRLAPQSYRCQVSSLATHPTSRHLPAPCKAAASILGWCSVRSGCLPHAHLAEQFSTPVLTYVICYNIACRPS